MFETVSDSAFLGDALGVDLFWSGAHGSTAVGVLGCESSLRVAVLSASLDFQYELFKFLVIFLGA